MRTLSVLVAVLPTIIFLWLFWWLDRYEKEPRALLVGTFIWGAVPAIVLSLVLERLFTPPLDSFPEQLAHVLSSTLVAAPIEELTKAAALGALFHWAHAEFDGMLDGIVYGAVVGLGFAMIENVFYFWSAWEQGGFAQWVAIVPSRALVFGLNHAMYTAFTGIGFARARFEETPSARRRDILLGLLAAVGVHLAHNALSSVGLCMIGVVVDWAGVLIILAIAVLGWRHEKECLQTCLEEEVALGVLSEELLALVTTRGARYRKTLQQLREHGPRKAQFFARIASDAAELAQKKQQLTRMGEETGNGRTISELRTRIQQNRQRLGM